jgi:predicted patatin/cPLA2 family phospholipase
MKKAELLSKLSDMQVQLNNYKKYNLANRSIELSGEFLTVKKNRDYEYLVLSGGGAKGVSFLGAIQQLASMNIVFDENKKLKLKGIAASSAGSIIGALLAVGYSFEELKTKLMDLNFADVADDKVGYIRDTYNFVTKYGVCKGKYLYDMMGDLIAEKTGNPDYTLVDLYNEKKMRLIITTTNQNTKKTIYLDPKHKEKVYSHIPIRACVRMSTSVPFLFEPFEYNKCLFSDGGVLDNYPIHCFDCEDPGSPEALYHDLSPNYKVLGLKISSHDKNEKDNAEPIDHLYDYACSYIETFLAENGRKAYTKENFIRTIFIITPNYPLTKFDLTDKQKTDLVTAGVHGVMSYFNENVM